MTTLEDIHTACLALAADGCTPSGNTLVRYCHARGQRLSKRTALKALQALADAGEVFQPVRPAPAPAPAAAARPPRLAMWQRFAAHQQQQARTAPAPDPVQQARPVDPVARAVQALDAARYAMDDAVMTVFVAGGLIVDGTRYGGYAPDDPTRSMVQQTAKEATAAYSQAWQDLQRATATGIEEQVLARLDPDGAHRR